jgi:hypothetical protein
MSVQIKTEVKTREGGSLYWFGEFGDGGCLFLDEGGKADGCNR